MGYLSGFKRSLFGKNTTGRLGGSYRVTLRKGIMFDTLDVTHLREPQIKACVRELKFGIKRDLYAAALYTYNSENRNFVLSEEVYF